MTNIDWLLWSVAIIACGYLAVLAWKKAPQLSLVDPTSSREAKAKDKKNAILEARMLRQVEEKSRVVWKSSLRPVLVAIQEGFRRFAGKLTAIERRYVERQRGGEVDSQVIRHMVEEARHAVANNRFDLAEKTLIAIVSHDPKHTEAYEMLGRMYFVQGRYSEAKETWEFLEKLSPKDASIMVALGEVHEALKDERTAFEYYKKGMEVSPNNPKYLDFFIQSALEVGEYHEAQAAVDRLREVNPENKKIALFEAQLQEKKRSS